MLDFWFIIVIYRAHIGEPGELVFSTGFKKSTYINLSIVYKDLALKRIINKCYLMDQSNTSIKI